MNVKSIQLNSVFQAERAVVNISGGSIGDHQLDSLVGDESTLTVTGGYLEGVSVTSRSTASVSGGRVGYLQITSETQARIDGGQVDWLGVHSDAVAEVRAGIVGDTDNIDGTTRIFGGAWAIAMNGSTAPWSCTAMIFKLMVLQSPGWTPWAAPSN